MKQTLSMIAIFFAVISYVQGSLADHYSSQTDQSQSTTVVKGEVVYEMNFEADSPKQADGRYIWRSTSYGQTTKFYVKPSIKAPFPEKPMLKEELQEAEIGLLVFNPTEKWVGLCEKKPCEKNDMIGGGIVRVEANDNQTGFVATKDKENELFFNAYKQSTYYVLDDLSLTNEETSEDKLEEAGYERELKVEVSSGPHECIFKGGIAGLKSVVNCRSVIHVTIKAIKASK